MAEVNFSDLGSSDFVQTLNGHLAQLEQWRGQIRESFSHLSTLADQQTQLNDNLHFPDEAEAQANAEQMKQQFEEVANALETGLNQAITTLGDHLQRCGDQLEQAAGIGNQAHQALLTSSQQCGDVCQGEAENALQGFGELTQEVQNLTGVLQSLSSDHEQVFNQLAQALGDHWLQTTQQFSSSFHNDLSNTHVQRLATQFEQGLQHVNQLHDSFNQGAHQVSNDFAQSLTDLFQRVSDHIGEQMQSGMQDAASHLVEGATQRFGEEIIEAMVMSEAGVSVTTALSPYLPELAAIKQVADAIIAALEAIKKLQSGDVLGAVGVI